MGWQNLTTQQTDVIQQHLKFCYGHSQMPEQNLSSKYFSNCLPEMSYTTAFQNSSILLRKQWLHSLCSVCSLWGANHLLYMKIIIRLLRINIDSIRQNPTKIHCHWLIARGKVTFLSHNAIILLLHLYQHLSNIANVLHKSVMETRLVTGRHSFITF